MSACNVRVRLYPISCRGAGAHNPTAVGRVTLLRRGKRKEERGEGMQGYPGTRWFNNKRDRRTED